MQQYRVVLRRTNGRFVRDWVRNSKYAAKKLKQSLENKYDESYYFEVIEPGDTEGQRN